MENQVELRLTYGSVSVDARELVEIWNNAYEALQFLRTTNIPCWDVEKDIEEIERYI